MIYLLSTIFVFTVLGFIYREKINENEMTFDEELSLVIASLPENKIICEEILLQIGNNKTIVGYNPYKEAKGSFYKHKQDKIVLRENNELGDISRIVHIAHECVHSTQKESFLNMNFIFSNLQMLYFIVLIVLRFFNIPIRLVNLLLFVQILLVLATFFVKVVIESDACYKSVSVAEKYLQNKMSESQLAKYVRVLSNNLTKMIPMYYFGIISQGLTMAILSQIVYLF